MTCKEFERSVVLFLYEELSESERGEVTAHLNSCPSCKKLYLENQRLLEAVDAINIDRFQPQWEHYWSNIVDNIQTDRRIKWTVKPTIKWTLGFAASILLLALGLVIGRFWLQNPPPKSDIVFQQQEIPAEFINSYLQDVQPILIDFINQPSANGSADKGLVEKKWVQSLLLQTRLLRHRMSSAQDPYLEDLLNDLELVLLEMKNVLPGDFDSRRGLQQSIRDKGIPLKIKLYKPQSQREENI